MNLFRFLTQVRQLDGESRAKSFRRESEGQKSALHFEVRSKAVRQLNTEVMEEELLLSVRSSDSTKADLTAIGCGKDNIGAVKGGEQGERFGWGEIGMGGLEQMLQRHPKGIAEESNEDMSLRGHPATCGVLQ